MAGLLLSKYFLPLVYNAILRKKIAILRTPRLSPVGLAIRGWTKLLGNPEVPRDVLNINKAQHVGDASNWQIRFHQQPRNTAAPAGGTSSF